MKNIFRLLASIVVVSCSGLTACSQTKSASQKIAVGAEQKFELKVFDNSETFSRIFALNDQGAVLGTREVTEENGIISSSVYFYDDGKQSIDLPGLEGFTNLEVAALSEKGQAVGFASRPVGGPGVNLTAILWDSATNQVTNLGALPDDTASQAQGISDDGTRIVGYSTGSEPTRLRPCLWQWNADAKTWEPQALPTVELFNPYLMSSSATISPDGNRIACCATEAFLENGIIDSSLYMWELQDGVWTRTKICDEQMRLHAINDLGVMVGELSEGASRRPCSIDLQGKVARLDFLPGDVSGEALGINNDGLIVGLSDDKPGLEGGPQACVWRGVKATPLELPEGCIYGAAYCINNQGQIGGMTDITIPDQTIVNPETGESEPLVKAVGFVWTPAGLSSSKK